MPVAEPELIVVRPPELMAKPFAVPPEEMMISPLELTVVLFATPPYETWR